MATDALARAPRRAATPGPALEGDDSDEQDFLLASGVCSPDPKGGSPDADPDDMEDALARCPNPSPEPDPNLEGELPAGGKPAPDAARGSKNAPPLAQLCMAASGLASSSSQAPQGKQASSGACPALPGVAADSELELPLPRARSSTCAARRVRHVRHPKQHAYIRVEPHCWVEDALASHHLFLVQPCAREALVQCNNISPAGAPGYIW